MKKKGNFNKFIDEKARRRKLSQDKLAKSKKKKEEKEQRKHFHLQKEISSAPKEGFRLNQYIARCGVCSRREADNLIKAGNIKVNGKVVKEMGLRVNPAKDKVEFNGKVLGLRKFVYFLMNKPKNHITTLSDEKGRRTVYDIIKKHTRERIYPVGRLDRNTTGLLLFTNDGDLADKLMHPSNNVSKVYKVMLEQPLQLDDLKKLRKGVTLEDGFIKPDKVEILGDSEGYEVGIEIHSGKNRIVRRIFEHLGYPIRGLDRTEFGPLNKKNLPRGFVRELTEQEVGFLNML